MVDKKKTSELTTNSSPSTSATLVGVDNGETVQIPITEFVTKDGNGGVNIRTKQGKNIIEVCETEDESYTVIQSNALQLHGVSTLRTYDDKEGKDGQVLTKKDGLVIWGDIPSIDGLASTSYVDTKVAGIVNSAPAALDTLNELSKALGNDANFSATVATQIGNKVDKENGKGLSTNDYTTAEKNKLAGIAEGANNYSHPDSHPASMITGLSKVATSGSYNDLTDKPTIPSGGGSGGGIISVDTLPTENIDTSAIYRVEEISKATTYVLGTPGPEAIIVDKLPETGSDDDLYFLTTDQKIYGYASADIATEIGIPEGWADQAELYGMPLVVSSSVDEVIAADLGVLLTKRDVLYCYCDGEFTKIITSKNFEFDETTGTLVLNL